MPWELRDEEFDALLALPGPKRYEYFVKKVADWEELWALGEEERLVTAVDDDGRELLPIWPHPRYAMACAEAEWAGARAVRLSLAEWLEWLPELAAEGRRVAVFPTPDGAGVHVPATRVLDDLDAELGKYRDT